MLPIFSIQAVSICWLQYQQIFSKSVKFYSVKLTLHSLCQDCIRKFLGQHCIIDQHCAEQYYRILLVCARKQRTKKSPKIDLLPWGALQFLYTKCIQSFFVGYKRTGGCILQIYVSTCKTWYPNYNGKRRKGHVCIFQLILIGIFQHDIVC